VFTNVGHRPVTYICEELFINRSAITDPQSLVYSAESRWMQTNVPKKFDNVLLPRQHLREFTFIEAGDCKVNETQLRVDYLQGIFDRFDTAQIELELSDNTDHTGDGEAFERQYYEVKAKFSEVLHPVVELPRSRHSSTGSSPRSHNSGAHIKLPTIALPNFDGETCNWLQFRDTFEALIVNNTSLTDVQRFHYLVASLKNEAKDLVIYKLKFLSGMEPHNITL